MTEQAGTYQRPVRDSERCDCACGKYGCASRRKVGVTSHGASGYTNGCSCEECTEAHVRKSIRQRSRVNDETKQTATRHGGRWTGADLEIALREDLTAQEAARILGRSLSAVKNARTRSRREPKYAAMLGAPRA